MDPADAALVFETRRLRAVPWRRSHAASAFAMYGDPEVGRFIGGHHADLETTRNMIETILERAPTLPWGMGSFPLLLRDEPAGELVGCALIKPLPDANERRTEDVEIGWHLARQRWGNGFATEAGHALLRLGFEQLGLEVLHAVVDAANQASHAVARRLGLEELGPTRAWYGGRELVHYRIERERWRGRRDGA